MRSPRVPAAGRRPVVGVWAGVALVALAWVAPGVARAEGPLSALEGDVDAIATRALPSVVTVFAQRPGESRARDGRTVVRTHTRVGSGVAVDANGVMTTASVVLGAQRIVVRTANGLEADAVIVGCDPIFNLALLRVPDLRLPTLDMASGRGPQLGDWVIAVGTTYGARPTQSVGNVAYVHREPRFALLQLTNTVVPGNSGAAALNTRGELVGIVQGDLGDAGSGTSGDAARASGFSFAIPLETVRPVYESFRREGRVRHGYLGVTTRQAQVASESESGASVPIGALIESVVSDGPAARAGLQRGDLIVGFEHDRVEYPEQLARWISASRPGSSVALVWVRDDLEKTGTVVLTESPDATPGWALGLGGPGDGSPPRITEIERQIQRLNQQLQLLKNQGGTTPH
ncbi:MAG TPA: trypsin-like peptidase domain-containing protein [Candidatus Saccharimonadaceae bacterium]|nr:trypsin-like peptidase domain-containing protein [Candidatus Saccharimonadaceae bacterium]